MTMPKIIRSSADLRNYYGEISRECREDGKAVIITVNGRGDTVSLSYQDYEYLKAKTELHEMLGKAENDVRSGRTAPLKDSFDSLRKELKAKQR